MASCAVLYLTGMRRVLLEQVMSASAMVIFCMREPVMFHSVVLFTRLPGEPGLYGWHLLYSAPSSGVSNLQLLYIIQGYHK